MKKISYLLLTLCLFFSGCSKNDDLNKSYSMVNPEKTNLNATSSTVSQSPYGTEVWILLGSPIPTGWVTIRSTGTSLLIRKFQ